MQTVTVLIGAVSLVIYSTLSQGIKIWLRLSSSVPDEDSGIFAEKFARDLRNSLNLGKIKFIGSKEDLSFATLVNSQSNQPGLRQNIGEVKYFFNNEKKALIRTQKNYSQIYMDEHVPEEVLLNSVKSLNFKYYTFDKLENAYVWLEDWVEEGIPRAVRIEFEFSSANQDRQFIKTVSLPLGK